MPTGSLKRFFLTPLDNAKPFENQAKDGRMSRPAYGNFELGKRSRRF
jgi:hypothetical protein